MAPPSEAGKDDKICGKQSLPHANPQKINRLTLILQQIKGMVHMVLAPTMGRIKYILPERVGTLLTKAWIQKLEKDVVGKPRVTIAISYMEYLIRLQSKIMKT